MPRLKFKAANGTTSKSSHGPLSNHKSSNKLFVSDCCLTCESNTANKASISLSSGLMARNTPPPASASFCNCLGFILATTILPTSSFKNPPSGVLMGPPCSVPTPKIDNLYCFKERTTGKVSSKITPSVTSKISPLVNPACLNKSTAFSIASAVLLPCTGMISVVNADN